MNSIQQGLGINAQKSPHPDAIIQALADSEQDPKVKQIMLGLEPVGDKPGYYRNAKENLLIKYNPNTDTAPTFMNIANTGEPAKSVIDPKLINE